MEGVSAAASVFGVIQLTGSIVKICGGYLQEIKNAREDIIALQRSITGLEGTVRKLFEFLQGLPATKLPTSSLLVNNVTDCLSDLEALENKIDPGNGKGMMRRLGFRAFKWPLKRTEVDKIIHGLERYKSSFTLSLQIDQTALLAGVAWSAELIHQGSGLDKLPIAAGAEFDSYMDQHEDECLPGTRTELLRQITEWAMSSQGKCIYWLNGMAGTGKSTISRTVAKSLKEANLLGASFFFKRGEGSRGSATKLFPTIARQFALSFPQLIPGIQKAISDDPDFAAKSLKEQFDKLLLQPLFDLGKSTRQLPTTVIVIDALDECEVDNDIRIILQLLPRLRELSTGPVRVFLTSRPDLPIKLGFSEIQHIDYQDLVLHDIPEAVIAHDISLFLNSRLSNIRKQRSLPVDWPSGTDVQALVTLSVPLFIFAATVCRVLEDPQWDPEESLTEILTHRGDRSQLDRTYLPVLNRVLNNQSERQKIQLIQEFREILGIIVVLESPLSVCSLSTLTGLSENLISRRLNSLHSVIRVPEKKTIPLRPFHLSFRDFLLDPESRDKTPLWVEENEVHKNLATKCISVCYKLKRNICGLTSDGTLRSEIDPQIVSSCLPSELQYSCRFWAQHLMQSQDRNCLIQDAFIFLQKHFLHWMEAMSVLGLVSGVVRIIDLLQTMAFDGENPEIAEFVHDAKRFALKTRQIADNAPLQIYCAGLIFAPRMSIIRKKFESELPDYICRLPDVEDAWNAELQVLEGHSDWVFSVSFSPDGKRIASGSSDNTIRLWDPVTGTLQQTIEGHLDWVRSVAFSPDGRVLASGSSDNTVRLWDSATGALQQTLEGHLGSVWSVAFSPDGRILASGSFDQTIRLWDPITGVLQRTFKGILDSIWSLAFSPDSQVLASASRDNTVRLWDPITGSLQRTLEGHSGSVWSVAFSPNGRMLASGSSDQTIRLWDPTSGILQQILEGHQEGLRSVTFSPDSRIVASSDNKPIIRLWDPATGTLLQKLKGHSNSVWSLAFSPNGRLLASGSYDQTVRIWDSTMSGLNQTLESHSGILRSVVFSPDGKLLASGSDDYTVRLWDPITGDLKWNLKGHVGSVLLVLFSPNSQLLASGSTDQTVRLWDSSTGNLHRILEGQFDWPRSIVFSPDSQVLASSFDDQTIRLWDTTTGALLYKLEGHIDWLRCLAFSPNGRLLASGSDDWSVRLWDISTGALQQTLEGHTDWVRSVSFSPDGSLLASSSYDQTVRLWDIATGHFQRAIQGHSGPVRSVTFSCDSRLLASGSSDQTVRLWDPTTGCLQQIIRSFGVVTDLAFFGDSRLDTNLGCLNIRSSNGDCNSNLDQTSLEIFIRESQWITMNGEKVIWLPPEFRPICSAIRGNTLALGHASGRVSFIGCDIQ
ncbi:NACHT and WD40 domain protein [Aspergillus candidus]|uniref:NACHT and WD40 domain protein n=1 Tax=Aspergillus candidus TaxID=41067 RepID=A0A2I2F5E2_ASPCN|nr:NACHT and WD40 domain protein [Aspergillus candidus]PLB35837.1 NACHT and WD40 domain protein [Aspergillus candidus]